MEIPSGAVRPGGHHRALSCVIFTRRSLLSAFLDGRLPYHVVRLGKVMTDLPGIGSL